jgi:hypothetical protein
VADRKIVLEGREDDWKVSFDPGTRKITAERTPAPADLPPKDASGDDLKDDVKRAAIEQGLKWTLTLEILKLDAPGVSLKGTFDKKRITKSGGRFRLDPDPVPVSYERVSAVACHQAPRLAAWRAAVEVQLTANAATKTDKAKAEEKAADSWKKLVAATAQAEPMSCLVCNLTTVNNALSDQSTDQAKLIGMAKTIPHGYDPISGMTDAAAVDLLKTKMGFKHAQAAAKVNDDQLKKYLQCGPVLLNIREGGAGTPWHSVLVYAFTQAEDGTTAFLGWNPGTKASEPFTWTRSQLSEHHWDGGAVMANPPFLESSILVRPR